MWYSVGYDITFLCSTYHFDIVTNVIMDTVLINWLINTPLQNILLWPVLHDLGHTVTCKSSLSLGGTQNLAAHTNLPPKISS